MELSIEWTSTQGGKPPKAVSREFLWLFQNEENPDGVLKESTFEEILRINNNYLMTREVYKKRDPVFSSYENILKECNL